MKQEFNLKELLEKYGEELDLKVDQDRNILEILRELWLMSKVLDEEHKKVIQDKILIIYDMATRMMSRLKEYDKDWDKQCWKKNLNYEDDIKMREEYGRHRN